MRQVIIAPSILAADYGKLEQQVQAAAQGGAEYLHIDVMDGSFVPNITFGQEMVAAMRRITDLVLDVHLMTDRPERFVESFVSSGADSLTFHLEATVHAHRTLQAVKDAGLKPGISIVPSTPVEALSEVLPFVDLVLIMSVNPGFSGQKMILPCLEKLSRLKKIREERSYNYLLSVDGAKRRGRGKLPDMGMAGGITPR